MWRFLTAAVFHMGALHIAFNMLAFVPIGALSFCCNHQRSYALCTFLLHFCISRVFPVRDTCQPTLRRSCRGSPRNHPTAFFHLAAVPPDCIVKPAVMQTPLDAAALLCAGMSLENALGSVAFARLLLRTASTY